MGLRKPKIQPAPVSNSLPEMPAVQKLPAFEQKEKGGTGVPQEYKNKANSSANIMWRAKVKGRKVLADNIPLHMSLKTFDKAHELPHDEVANKVKELGIERPDPSKLQYEPTTFTSQRNGQTYYMLKLHGHDPSYDKFVEHFKGRGITYPNFMGHITIDKELHDQIQKEGIQPHEVEFSPLMIEHGADNPTHMFPDSSSHQDHASDLMPKLNSQNKEGKVIPFPRAKFNKSEDLFLDLHDWHILEKGTLKNLATAGAVIGALTGTPHVAAAPNKPAHSASAYSTGRMLQAISQVESSGGKNQAHKAIPGAMHHGESAVGSYGLTPIVIRETIKMNPDLKRHYPRAASLQGNDLQRYFQDNPGLEQKVAESHLRRLEHHFGGDPAKLGMAWLDGITGTKQKIKQGFDPNSHWHAQKVVQAYGKGK